LNQLMEVMTDSIFFKNLKSEFVYAIQELADRLGVKSPENLYGKTDYDFFDLQTAIDSKREEEAIIESGKECTTKRFTTPRLTQQGTYRLIKKVPIKENGRVILIAGIAKDISDLIEAQEQLELQNKLLETIFENIPQCIWIKDLNLEYLKCNTRFAL